MDMDSRQAILLRVTFSPIFLPVLLLGVMTRSAWNIAGWFFDELAWAFGYGSKWVE